MATGTLSLKPTFTALHWHRQTFQTENSQKKKPLSLIKQHAMKRREELAPCILNLALDGDEGSALSSRTLSFMKRRAEVDVKKREISCQWSSVVQPAARSLYRLSYAGSSQSQQIIRLLTAQYSNKGGKNSFWVSAHPQAVCVLVLRTFMQLTQTGTWTHVRHHFLIYRHRQLLYGFVTFYCLSP
jgi:hypothetical protein